MLSPTAERLLQLARENTEEPKKRLRGWGEDFEPAISVHLEMRRNKTWITDWLIKQVEKAPAKIKQHSKEWHRYYHLVRRVEERMNADLSRPAAH
jgi:hypothetical protein